MMKFSKLILLLSLFFLIITNAQATEGSLEGKVNQGVGYVIRLSTYTDRLSFHEQIIDQQVVDTSGSFKLSFDIADIQELIIRIGFQSFTFYAESGKSYKLEIDQLNLSQSNALYKQKPLKIKWEKRPLLNETIDNFNYSFSNFLENNFLAIYKFRDTKLIQLFENEMQEKLNATTELNPEQFDFLKSYITYQVADLKKASHTISDNQLIEHYLQEKILYDQPNYMLFFSHLFSKYLETNTIGLSYSKFNLLLEQPKKAALLMEFLEKDTKLKDERLRELVLLKIAKDVYYRSDFNQAKIKNLLEEISRSSKFIEHQKIGKTLINKLGRLSVGSVAPSFKLKNSQGASRILKDYSGKYVYLVFSSDDCPTCELDSTSLKHIQERYTDDLRVVNIRANYHPISNPNKQYPQKIESLLFDNDFELLDTYQVKIFPYFMLLDREGKILLNPAKKPDDGMDHYLDFLIKKDLEKVQRKDLLFR